MGMQAAWMVSVPVASTVLRERSEKPQRPDRVWVPIRARQGAILHGEASARLASFHRGP